jgi:hypothetical protein
VNKELIEKGNRRADLGKVVSAGGQMVQTEGGLIVPASSVEDKRTRRVWDWQMWKNLRRMIRFFAQEEIVMVLQCRSCQKVLRPVQKDDGYNLECDCRVREVRPGS